jgi:hypothetical protein
MGSDACNRRVGKSLSLPKKISSAANGFGYNYSVAARGCSGDEATGQAGCSRGIAKLGAEKFVPGAEDRSAKGFQHF